MTASGSPRGRLAVGVTGVLSAAKKAISDESSKAGGQRNLSGTLSRATPGDRRIADRTHGSAADFLAALPNAQVFRHRPSWQYVPHPSHRIDRPSKLTFPRRLGRTL